MAGQSWAGAPNPWLETGFRPIPVVILRAYYKVGWGAYPGRGFEGHPHGRGTACSAHRSAHKKTPPFPAGLKRMNASFTNVSGLLTRSVRRYALRPHANLWGIGIVVGPVGAVTRRAPVDMRLADPSISWRRRRRLVCYCSTNDCPCTERGQRIPPAIIMTAIAGATIPIALVTVMPAVTRRRTAIIRTAISLPAWGTASVAIMTILNLVDIGLDDGLFRHGV